MKLSIILPTYNMQQYLGRCIDSLLDQDLAQEDYEIIVVNDESKDNTLKVAQGYADKFSNVVIVDKKNGGAGAARNSGLEVAKGEYIHFVDPDDYVAKDVYGKLIDLATENELDLLNFIFTKTTKTDLRESTTDFSDPKLDQLDIQNGVHYIANNNYRNTVWWYLINRKFLNSSGLSFIEGRWMEDSILTPQLFMKAKRMAYVPIDVYRYMITPNSAMTSKEPKHYNKLIYDIKEATHDFDHILKSIETDNADSKNCWQRLKTRQQSFVFFLLVRLMKSGLPVKNIKEMLPGFKEIQAYPLDNFGGSDFNGVAYRLLTFIFNREAIITPFMTLFRLFYRPISLVKK